MKRPAKSALAKLSKQKSNKMCRSANFRFFAKFRRNKYNNKLPRDVGALPRRINADKDSTSGIVLPQEEFKFKVGMHKKITHYKLPREVGAVPHRTNVVKEPTSITDTSTTFFLTTLTHGGKFASNDRDSTSGKVVLAVDMHKKNRLTFCYLFGQLIHWGCRVYLSQNILSCLSDRMQILTHPHRPTD